MINIFVAKVFMSSFKSFRRKRCRKKSLKNTRNLCYTNQNEKTIFFDVNKTKRAHRRVWYWWKRTAEINQKAKISQHKKSFAVHGAGTTWRQEKKRKMHRNTGENKDEDLCVFNCVSLKVRGGSPNAKASTVNKSCWLTRWGNASGSALLKSQLRGSQKIA